MIKPKYFIKIFNFFNYLLNHNENVVIIKKDIQKT